MMMTKQRLPVADVVNDEIIAERRQQFARLVLRSKRATKHYDDIFIYKNIKNT